MVSQSLWGYETSWLLKEDFLGTIVGKNTTWLVIVWETRIHFIWMCFQYFTIPFGYARLFSISPFGLTKFVGNIGCHSRFWGHIGSIVLGYLLAPLGLTVPPRPRIGCWKMICDWSNYRSIISFGDFRFPSFQSFLGQDDGWWFHHLALGMDWKILETVRYDKIDCFFVDVWICIYIYLENAKTIDHPCMADLSTYWQLLIVAAILFVNYYIHCLGYPTDPKHVDNKDPCLWYLYQPEHMVLSENMVFGSNLLPLKKREHGQFTSGSNGGFNPSIFRYQSHQP